VLSQIQHTGPTSRLLQQTRLQGRSTTFLPLPFPCLSTNPDVSGGTKRYFFSPTENRKILMMMIGRVKNTS